MTRREAAGVALVAVAALLGCGQGTPAIAYDVDACDFCRMTISDQRFGAVARTAGGRLMHFDSIECLAGWITAQDDPPREIWVTDAGAPGVLIPIGKARFHRATVGRSPMGRGYMAVAATRPVTARDGAELSWSDVLAEVRREGVVPTDTTLTAGGGG